MIVCRLLQQWWQPRCWPKFNHNELQAHDSNYRQQKRHPSVFSYLKQSQDIGYHDGYRAGRRPDDAHHFIWLGKDWRVSISTANVRAIPLDECLNERERLLQGVGVTRTRVQDACPKRHVGQQLRVLVDEVNGEQHGLQPMDSLLLLQLTTGNAPLATSVHGEQATQDDVTIQPDGVGILLLGLLGVCQHSRLLGGGT